MPVEDSVIFGIVHVSDGFVLLFNDFYEPEEIMFYRNFRILPGAIQ